MALEVNRTNGWRIAIYYIFVTGAFVSLFVLGLKYSRDRVDPPGNTPYFFPCMVYAVITFLECILAAVIWQQDRKEHGMNGWKAANRISKVRMYYYLLTYLAIIWGVIGAALIGSTGLCYRDLEEEKNECYYDVNMIENRIIAVISIVLFVAVLMVHILFMFMKSNTDNTSVRSVKPNTRLLSSEVKLDRRHPLKTDDTKDINALRCASSGSTSPANSLKLSVKIPPRHKKQFKRHTSVFELTGNYSNHVAKTSPRPNERQKIRRLSKDVIVPKASRPSNENDPKHLSSGRQTQIRTRMENVISRLLARESEKETRLRDNGSTSNDRKPPPPSYRDAVKSKLCKRESEQDRNPYFLPPLPSNGPCSNQAPDNMYTGTSYPDTELIAVTPMHNHLSRCPGKRFH